MLPWVPSSLTGGDPRKAVPGVAAAAEQAGFQYVGVSDHPFPNDEWVESGGHHAFDPFVALSFAAAATTTITLQTNLLVAPYRNPILAAHSVASLSVLSGGRVCVGIGAGFLVPEFAALGVDFDSRNDTTDEALRIMLGLWRGERTAGSALGPAPTQGGGPPVWIGGNSRRAIRRAAEFGDGWCPVPTPPDKTSRRRTATLETVADVAAGIELLSQLRLRLGRTSPITVSFATTALATAMATGDWRQDLVLREVEKLSEVGVTCVPVILPAGSDLDQTLSTIQRFGADVISQVCEFPTIRRTTT
jgi:probable F420-dependent oxidoreductase